MDSKTLILAIVPVILAGVFIHAVNAAIQQNKDGPRWWLAATATHGIGLGLISLRGVVPDVLGIVLGDMMAAGGFIIMLEGVARFAGRRVPRWQLGALAAVVVLGFPAFTWGVDSAALRFAVFGVAVIVPNLLMLSYLSVIGRRDGNLGVRLLRYTIYYFVGSLAVISVGVLLFDPDMPSVLAPNQMVALGILSLMVVETNLVFGFVLLSAGHSASVLRKAALTDHLTGLPNRRAFEALVHRALGGEAEADRKSALAVFDVDHFKHVNDTHGHDVGDAVLQHVAQVLSRAIRDTDHVARLGGEEFVALIHASSPASASDIAERARQAVEDTPYVLNGKPIPVTISAGLVEVKGVEPSLTRLFKQADTALYEAKDAGRNRVILAAA
ncbi:diguanylate cyclase [uncultured Maricaulis sp.]|uniref:GGDEF domain-containing protein n=1 Tax=uncultured Maricaulis sp. TaxID=174710 RepID=UPI00260DD6A3|nr:GGDEF domain-containing protein [uncultured Maricaulis sp.]